MNCEEFRKYLVDYILDELDDDIEIQVNAHLADCPDCQLVLDKEKSLTECFMGLKKFEPPIAAYRRIIDNAKIGKKEKPMLLQLPNRLVFTAIAFVFGIIFMWSLDLLFISPRQRVQVDIRYQPTQRMPTSDTMIFNTAPAENLTKI